MQKFLKSTLRIFLSPKFPFSVFMVNLCSLLWSPLVTNLVPVFIDLTFLNMSYTESGIIQHEILCLRLVSFNIMFLRVSHILEYINISFSQIVDEEYLDYFQFQLIMNDNGRSICVQVYMWKIVPTSLEQMSRSRIAVS